MRDPALSDINVGKGLTLSFFLLRKPRLHQQQRRSNTVECFSKIGATEFVGLRSFLPNSLNTPKSGPDIALKLTR